MLKAIVCIAALLFSLSITAQPYKNAIGLKYSGSSYIGGAAINYKHFISEKAAIEAILSIRSPIGLGAIYQIHSNIKSMQNLTWFYGGGAFVSFDKPDFGLGILGNIGLDYKFDGVPINLALDWKPELAIAEKTGIDFNTFGFAIRYVIK